MGTRPAARGIRLRGTLHNKGTRLRDTLRSRGTRLHLEHTLHSRVTRLHPGHTLHSSMGTLRLVATRSTVVIHLPVTPARPRRTRVMGVATAGAVDTWGQCWLEARLRRLRPMEHTRFLMVVTEEDIWGVDT